MTGPGIEPTDLGWRACECGGKGGRGKRVLRFQGGFKGVLRGFSPLYIQLLLRVLPIILDLSNSSKQHKFAQNKSSCLETEGLTIK